ncbi:MAG TPA: hypothetical protein EYO73_04245 [Sulfurimonas sp.]|nr:hypothetical protein [Sulfurimonas sp.]
MIKEALERIQRTKEENLHYLDLRGLGLEEIPNEILEVPWIGALSLSDNKISNINLLSKMTNIHKLALTNNNIEDISVLESLEKLRFIFLAENNIKDISKIKGQTRLKKLVLHNNEINILPDLSAFSLLAYLDIMDNPLITPTVKEIQVLLPSLKIYKY